jgi:hypothetical protein
MPAKHKIKQGEHLSSIAKKYGFADYHTIWDDSGETGKPVRSPGGKYRRMAFGPVGRSYPPRVKYAGTYDQNWAGNVCPFLPADFDERYYQAASEDQQTNYLAGGEAAELVNLTPNGRAAFVLPRVEVPVELAGATFSEMKHAVYDTAILESDAQRLLLVWRTALLLKRNLFEVQRVIVGRMSRGWYRTRERSKAYYRSLADMPWRCRGSL